MELKNIIFRIFLVLQITFFSFQLIHGYYDLGKLLPVQPDIVVAQDGSGDYKTVTEAVNAMAKLSGSQRRVIHVKAGIYMENVLIETNDTMLVGDGIGKTIITGTKSADRGYDILSSATVSVGVTGNGFICEHITIRNTAGPQNHQAVALRSDADHSVFYRCSIEGYQDTLFARTNKQFYRECDIYGTIDFIFGNAAAVFQNCIIYLRNPPNKTNVITSQSRNSSIESTGFSIHNSIVKAASDLKGVSGVKSYLGRPWMNYSRTVFMKTYLDSLIDPVGWMEWDGKKGRLTTLYYGEYKNSGPGSSTAERVKWKGYKVIEIVAEASKFTVGKLIEGDSWLPATGVPYTSGL